MGPFKIDAGSDRNNYNIATIISLANIANNNYVSAYNVQWSMQMKKQD